MKRLLLLLSFFLVGPVFAQQQAVPQIPFRSVPDFLKLPPDMYLGEVSGVAVNSKGHVFVFTRGNTNGPAMGLPPRSFSSLMPPENTFARLATICTPGPLRTR